MARSINGWEVIGSYSDPRLRTAPIPACPSRRLTMRREVLPLFLALASDYHRRIAPLDVGPWDEWSYSYRPARTSTAWSNHASGTAVDLNAAAEGARGILSAAWWRAKRRNVRAWRIRRRYAVVTWGGWAEYADDPSTPDREGWEAAWSDPMHWELKPGTTLEDVLGVIARLQISPDGVRKTRRKMERVGY